MHHVEFTRPDIKFASLSGEESVAWKTSRFVRCAPQQPPAVPSVVPACKTQRKKECEAQRGEQMVVKSCHLFKLSWLSHCFHVTFSLLAPHLCLFDPPLKPHMLRLTSLSEGAGEMLMGVGRSLPHVVKQADTGPFCSALIGQLVMWHR